MKRVITVIRMPNNILNISFGVGLKPLTASCITMCISPILIDLIKYNVNVFSYLFDYPSYLSWLKDVRRTIGVRLCRYSKVWFPMYQYATNFVKAQRLEIETTNLEGGIESNSVGFYSMKTILDG